MSPDRYRNTEVRQKFPHCVKIFSNFSKLLHFFFSNLILSSSLSVNYKSKILKAMSLPPFQPYLGRESAYRMCVVHVHMGVGSAENSAL